MKKTLFLDFDGVLHGTGPQAQGFFEHMALFCESVRPFRDNLAIVISSSWRENLSFNELQNLFEEDIQPCVVGITPVHTRGYEYAGREKEILEYCAQHSIGSQDWVALDDMARLFTDACPNLILVDSVYGIQTQDTEKLKQFLQQGYAKKQQLNF